MLKQASTINDSDFGADVFAQRFMMMLVLKDMVVDISLVDAVKSREMKKLPALKPSDSEELLEDPKDIEAHIEKISPHCPLRIPEESANMVLVTKGHGSGVYHKFCQLAKNVDPSTDEKLKGILADELYALNDDLRKNAGKFLGGEKLVLPDCILLPKLLHIKVVAKAFKDFDIPEDCDRIHEYMKNANEEEAFTRTSPSEEVIVGAWARAMNPLQKNLLQKKGRKH